MPNQLSTAWEWILANPALAFVFAALAFPIFRLIYILVRHFMRQGRQRAGSHDHSYEQDMMVLMNNQRLRTQVIAMKRTGEKMRAVDHVLKQTDVDMRAARDFVDRL
jgi:hypothetical protein